MGKDEVKKPLQFQKPCRLPNGVMFIPVKFVKGPTIKAERIKPDEVSDDAEEAEAVSEKKKKKSKKCKTEKEVEPEVKAEVKVEKKNVDKKFKMEVDHNKLDKMFAACKGLVIHRGSKYGLNSRSKMARLAEQEMKQNILKAEKNIKKEKIKVVEDVKVEAVV